MEQAGGALRVPGQAEAFGGALGEAYGRAELVAAHADKMRFYEQLNAYCGREREKQDDNDKLRQEQAGAGY